MRWLRMRWRRPARGPYTAEDVRRALSAEGWRPAEPPYEGRLYRHPDKPGTVAINPDWDHFFEGDPAFQILCRQMGISPSRLSDLLERE
jgi:hypothetical protein